jgi:hypothetical protein
VSTLYGQTPIIIGTCQLYFFFKGRYILEPNDKNIQEKAGLTYNETLDLKGPQDKS